MADKKETSTPVVNDKVLAVSAVIEKEISLDKKTGQGTVGDDLFGKTLGTINQVNETNVTEESIVDASKANALFVAGASHAFGVASLKAMASSKDLASTNMSAKMTGRDSVEITVDRTRTYRNPLAEGAPVVKHGVITTSYNTQVGANTGSLKAVRKAVEAAAAEKLSK